MIRIVLMLTAAVFYGCNSTEGKSENKLSAGTYQAELTIGSTETTLSLEEDLGADGSYRGRAFLSDGNRTCLIIEGIGSWTIHEKGFNTRNVFVKSRRLCEEEFSEAETVPDDLTELRNVTSKGFEEYFEGENQPAQWVEFSRL